MNDTEWTLWSERRPEDTKALYRWRIPARMICGMMLRPEWSAKLQYCGMGYGPSEWWPEYSRWDGYVRSVPAGMEWRLAREGEDAESIFWGGLDLLPCPHTGGAPKVTYRGRWLHAGPWDAESLSLRAWMVNSCGWADANKMVANWNLRPETPAADQTEAIDLTTYKGDPGAILALPGAVSPNQAPANRLVVVVVDRGGEEAELNEYQLSMQDSARYDVTLGHRSEASDDWETVGWNWEQDHFGSGGRRVVAAFPNAGLAEIDNPALLPRRSSVQEAAPAGGAALPYPPPDDLIEAMAEAHQGSVCHDLIGPMESAYHALVEWFAARAVAPAGVPEVKGELRYFAHDASGGVTDFFATEAEAIAFAEEGVKVASEAANDDGEWEEGADQIYVGIVTHRAILQEREGGTCDLTFGLLSAAPTAQGQDTAPVQVREPVPVRCGSCGWLGDATELGEEGECGGDENCTGRPTEISDPAEMLEAWLDSEGLICGEALAVSGLIEQKPATAEETAEEAAQLDIEEGDTVWHISADGNALLDARRSSAPSAGEATR